MNAPVLSTRAAEGYDRKAWTVAEIQAMHDAGLIDHKWPYELIQQVPTICGDRDIGAF